LHETNELVAILKEELIILEPKLKAGTEEVSKLIKVLEKQQIESDAVKNVVAADEAIAKVNNKKKIKLKNVNFTSTCFRSICNKINESVKIYSF